jgi:hypothetical protein
MKTELWKWIVGGLLGLVVMLGSYGFLSLEARVEKLENAPERLAAVEVELRLLREEVKGLREDVRALAVRR